MTTATKKTWIESPACKGRKQCRGCRCDERFQAKLPEYFVMPDGWPDCPFGITAETVPDPPDAPVYPARRREICQRCGWACGLDQRSGCYVRRFLATARSTCPEGHWRAEPDPAPPTERT